MLIKVVELTLGGWSISDSFLSSGKVGQSQTDTAEDKCLRELYRLLIAFLFACIIIIFFITVRVNVVLALLNPEGQVEELLEMS